MQNKYIKSPNIIVSQNTAFLKIEAQPTQIGRLLFFFNLKRATILGGSIFSTSKGLLF